MKAVFVFHIVSSVLAVSVMLLAAIEALFLCYQDYRLRHAKPSHPWLGWFDLESMEVFLFRTIAFGFGLLTIIILSSFYFFFEMKNIFFLKFFISFLAWCIFAVLLWCRYYYGLRGRVAVLSTLIGVGILLGIYIYSAWF